MPPKRKRQPSKASTKSDVSSAVASEPSKSVVKLASLTKNDNLLENFGIVEKGLNQLKNVPALSLKLEDLTLLSENEAQDLEYTIQCRNIQERPPLESFNSIKQPFLPILPKFDSSQVNENHSQKLAFELTNQYDLWKQRISARSIGSKLNLFFLERAISASFSC